MCLIEFTCLYNSCNVKVKVLSKLMCSFWAYIMSVIPEHKYKRLYACKSAWTHGVTSKMSVLLSLFVSFSLLVLFFFALPCFTSNNPLLYLRLHFQTVMIGIKVFSASLTCLMLRVQNKSIKMLVNAVGH